MLDLEKTELSTGKVAILIITIIGFVAWFYNSVVIPINQIQATITQINETLADNKAFQQATTKHLNTLDQQVSGINQKMEFK